MAEYLAGLNRIEAYGSDEGAWRRFLAEADGKEGAPEAIKGFLLAVRDCCLAKGKEAGVPAFVERELAGRAGLDPEARERARLEQRVRRLIANLSLPDAADRADAADALGMIGPAASAAVPALGEVLQKDESEEVRRVAAGALGRIGPSAAAAVPALIEALHHLNVDIAVAATLTLRQIGETAVPALTEVLHNDQDETVRQAAADALRHSAAS